MCRDIETGAYTWDILKGPGAVSSYSGFLQVLNGGTLFVLSPGPNQPNAIYLVYDVASAHGHRPFLSRFHLFALD